MKLLGIAAPGLAVSPSFAHRTRELSPTGERLTGAKVPEKLSLFIEDHRHTSRRKARATPVHPAVPALVSLVCEAAREKGILAGVRGEAPVYPEAVPKPVGARASLSMAQPSVLRIEKLIGEL